MNTRFQVNVEQGFEEAGYQITSKNWLDRQDQSVDMAYAEYCDWRKQESIRRGVPEFTIEFDHPFDDPVRESGRECLGGCGIDNEVKILLCKKVFPLDTELCEIVPEEMVAQLSIEEMTELCVGTMRGFGKSVVGNASYCVPGAAGDTSSVLMESRGVKNMILADGPAGLRLQPTIRKITDIL